MKNILLSHYITYPKMQIQDAVKLIYQNEFGPGHLVRDEASSLERLREEMKLLENERDGEESHAVQSDASDASDAYDTSDTSDASDASDAYDASDASDTSDASDAYDAYDASYASDSSDSSGASDAFEDIGNGLCRLYLKAAKRTAISPATINKFFVYTANSVAGSIESFEAKLETLVECCRTGKLPFLPGEVETYLSEYKRQGYPPVRHSGIYNAAYSPSYRIVKSEFRKFFKVFESIDRLLVSKDKTITAIDGSSGSGKSILAALMGNIYDCNIFHMDDYFLTPEIRTEARLAEVGGNVDYIRFKQEIISGLQSGGSFSFKPYDCKTQTLGKPVRVSTKKLNIIEGVYSMHPTLADSYDLKIFLYTDPETQKLRILERNGPAMLQRFLDEWIPLENRYFSEMNIMQKCDIVIKT